MNHYSQNDEQEVILRFFGERKGRLLDIGAYDGRTFSNTRALLESGWNGYLIEPDPNNVVKILKDPPPNAEVICVAVSGYETLTHICIENYTDRGWASSIFYTPEDGRILKPEPTGVIVPSITLSHLKGCGDFQFISIDAEGMDFEILQSMPLKMLERCELLCIEPKDSEERKGMREFLSHVGFLTYHETPENLLVEKA